MKVRRVIREQFYFVEIVSLKCLVLQLIRQVENLQHKAAFKRVYSAVGKGNDFTKPDCTKIKTEKSMGLYLRKVGLVHGHLPVSVKGLDIFFVI